MEANANDINIEQNFGIFDCSKMEFISENDFSGEKLQKEQNINPNHNNISTAGCTGPNNVNIELIKKSNNNNEKYEKRKNRFKFKGTQKEKRIDKSNSIRKKERSRSRSN